MQANEMAVPDDRVDFVAGFPFLTATEHDQTGITQ